jgi:hypothetical protein
VIPIIAEIACPECGYMIYETENDFNTVYLLEGWWSNREKYDLAHQHVRFIEFTGKYMDILRAALTGPAHFRSKLQAAGR